MLELKRGRGGSRGMLLCSSAAVAGFGLLCPQAALAQQAAAAAQGQVSAAPVRANQTAPSSEAAPEPKSPDQQQAIVVTATRRETLLERTPMSVTAVTGADIQARGITDFNEIAQSVPGVALLSSGPGQTQFQMRGMPPTGGVSATVGYYLDDTPLTAPAGSLNGFVVIDPNLYDLNRVEILRGPQGTLYGSGSMGGTIRLIPNAPNPSRFEASAQGTLSGTKGGGLNQAVNAMLNIPLGNTAALRIVGSESHESGWISRIVIADGFFPNPSAGGTDRGNVAGAPVANKYKGVNDDTVRGVRASLLWRPIDNLSITPSVFYQKTTSHGVGDIDSNPGTNAHYQPFDIAEPFSDKFLILSLNAKYHGPGFDITSNTAEWKRKQFQQLDSSQDWQYGFGVPSFYISQGGIGPAISYIYTNSRQFSQEVRISSANSSRLSWQLGYFYSRFRSSYDTPLVGPDVAPLFGTTNLYLQIEPTHINQQAVFGELSFQLTPKLKATAGLRRYVYNEHETFALSGIAVTGSDAVQFNAASAHATGINPKFDLSYQANKDLLLYATAAKGFRPGAGNSPIPTTGPLGSVCEANLQALFNTTSFVPSPLSFAPDTVWSYEGGEKLSTLGGNLVVNGDVYYENWQNIQQGVVIPCGFGFQTNAGTAHIYGSEVEASAKPAEDLTLAANLGYTHARIVQALPGSGFTNGAPIQLVPTWTSTQSITYRHPVGRDLHLLARLENSYVGSMTAAVTHFPYKQPSYDLTNIRIGLEGQSWTASLFAKNIFNVRAILGTGYGATVINYPEYNRLTTGRPTTVGIDASYRWR